MISEKIIIEISSKTRADFNLAIDEAVKQIKEGCCQGSDRNEDDRYYFEVEEED